MPVQTGTQAEEEGTQDVEDVEMSAQLRRGVKILAFFQLRSLFRFHLLHSFVFLPYSLVPLSLASKCCVLCGSRVWYEVCVPLCVVDSPVAVAVCMQPSGCLV